MWVHVSGIVAGLAIVVIGLFLMWLPLGVVGLGALVTYVAWLSVDEDEHVFTNEDDL